jgi:hypothetical protein
MAFSSVAAEEESAFSEAPFTAAKKKKTTAANMVAVKTTPFASRIRFLILLKKEFPSCILHIPAQL